jgi:hypothetical protein
MFKGEGLIPLGKFFKAIGYFCRFYIVCSNNIKNAIATEGSQQQLRNVCSFTVLNRIFIGGLYLLCGIARGNLQRDAKGEPEVGKVRKPISDLVALSQAS